MRGFGVAPGAGDATRYYGQVCLRGVGTSFVTECTALAIAGAH